MVQTDKAFVQFETLAYGYRAAWKVMESYWKYFHDLPKPFNVRGIISRWAPPTENNTAAYIAAVERLGSRGRSVPYDTLTEEDMVPIVAAIARVENGTEADSDELQAGWRLFAEDYQR